MKAITSSLAITLLILLTPAFAGVFDVLDETSEYIQSCQIKQQDTSQQKEYLRLQLMAYLVEKQQEIVDARETNDSDGYHLSGSFSSSGFVNLGDRVEFREIKGGGENYLCASIKK